MQLLEFRDDKEFKGSLIFSFVPLTGISSAFCCVLPDSVDWLEFGGTINIELFGVVGFLVIMFSELFRVSWDPVTGVVEVVSSFSVTTRESNLAGVVVSLILEFAGLFYDLKSAPVGFYHDADF